MEDITVLPTHVQRFLTTISTHWMEPVVLPGKPSRLLWGDHDYSASCKRVEVRENQLLARCASPFPEDLRKKIDRRDLGDLMNLPLAGEFEDGTKFQAMYASIQSAGPTMIVAEGGAWSVGIDHPQSSYWVGKITGFGPHHYGNLRLHPSVYGTSMGYRLMGVYEYYLLFQRTDAHADRDGWLWVIDTKGKGAPDRTTVHSELRALQFAFGARLSLKSLHGFDADGISLREHLGGPWGDDVGESGIRTPVPVNDLSLSWNVALFECVSRAHNAHRDYRFDLALHHYVNALGGTIEGKYLALCVGLEAFAYWLTKDIGRSPWYDVDVWKKWVKSNKTAILDMAIPEAGDRVMSILYQAGKHAPTRTVQDALNRYKLTLSDEMATAVGGRNTIVHTSEMAGLTLGEPIEWRSALRDVDIVRTILVALIAKASEYDGPIIGWEPNVPMGEPVPPEGWWAIGSNARAVAERTFGSMPNPE